MKTPSDLHAMLTKEEHGTNAPAVHRAVTKSSSYSYKSSSSYKKQQHQIVQHCRKSKYVSSGRPCSTTTSLSGAFVSRLQHCRKSKYVASSRPCSTTTCASGAFIIKPRSTADQSASGFTLRTPATRCAFRQHSATLVDSSRQLPAALV